MASKDTTQPTQAIVAHPLATENDTPGANWQFENILVPTKPKDGELLISMLASGICHSDLTLTSGGHFKLPRVAGHEGAGYIKALGPNLTNKNLKERDPVLLSFRYCGQCVNCKKGLPSSCDAFVMNLVGQDDAFVSENGKEGINGSFFGQSSFAGLSVVQESCVIPAKDLIENEEELKLFSPLGCGYQTGAGAVLNIAKPGKEQSIMVAGLGGVGLAAIMAAKIAGCHEIIGIDRIASRVKLCEEVGATKGIDTSASADLTKTLKEPANGGRGPDFFIDTTGAPAVLEAAYHALAPRGTLIFIGASMDPKAGWSVDYRVVMKDAKKLVGCVEGDSNPVKFIPQLVKYYREGRFPIDKLTKYYKAADFKTALHDMHAGDAVKVVLEW
ncbi:hypothetical protein LTR78_005756 [Recurvomyces mirabilis]|uniref:Enoyl reductase (ER) domain-containing protein n=1 Tax=Recurvomyces mirabilis TaxID=574656 RepID=A0AAE0WM85_9PEZI|nr:hypothetical protein LTR78_005756 [Recurvomyces mirabilis]KAK5154135.1 hypothetical protein LTS14_006820 [Recurvomyces mirabilis]